jgi:hypothetical protein
MGFGCACASVRCAHRIFGDPFGEINYTEKTPQKILDILWKILKAVAQ